MSNQVITGYRTVNTLPSTLESGCLYFVRSGDGFDLHVVNNFGVPVRHNYIDQNTSESIAAGFTEGLAQIMLSASGQVGKTVLAAAYCHYDGAESGQDCKAQLSSLDDGNVLFVYANGSDYTNGVVLEGPIFLSKGEIYVVENIQPGSIFVASKGAYGFTQQKAGNNESPMPLMSLGLAFKTSFFFGYRDCENQYGFVHVVNGPVASLVMLLDGNGAPVLDANGQQQMTVLTPWQYHRFYTDGDKEYQLQSSSAIMAAICAKMLPNDYRFHDSRLILPLTDDGICWARQGNMSAPYNNTSVDYYVNDGVDGSFSVSPGSPANIESITGANDQDYEPRGCTRFRAKGLITAYSGADSAGSEATPLCPVVNFSQRVALPLSIKDSGDGGNNGIAIASMYEGKARVFQWNSSTEKAELFKTVDLERRSGYPQEMEDQYYPCSALISNGSDPDSYDLGSDFNGGYVEANVPILVIFNSEQNQNGASNKTFRGTSGSNVTGIASDDDECLSFGVTPENIRTQIVLGTDDLQYRLNVGSGGGVWYTIG